MNSLSFKIIALLISGFVLSGCSVIAVVDTAVDVALLPVKVGVAVVEAAIPDDDDQFTSWRNDKQSTRTKLQAAQVTPFQTAIGAKPFVLRFLTLVGTYYFLDNVFSQAKDVLTIRFKSSN